MCSLALNAGSSSIKWKLYGGAGDVVGHGAASDIAGDAPTLSAAWHGEATKQTRLKPDDAYDKVFRLVLAEIDKHAKASEITLVAHRVVHGGAHTEPIVIRGSHTDDAVLEEMDRISAFAPLHNINALAMVKATLEALPWSTSVLCFDTLFHTSIAPHKTTYPVGAISHPIPVPLRRYGFHGLSYGSILRQMAAKLGKDEQQVSLVVVHAGSGASACLIIDGKSIDTSMGLTPLEGLPGGTRAGSVDPSLIFHHTPNSAILLDLPNGGRIARGELVLNKESGFKALTGTSDFGQIVERAFGAESDDGGEKRDKARLCYDLFVDRVTGYVASYLSQAGGKVDGIVFAGGIGERSSRFRADVMDSVAWIERLGGSQGGIYREQNEREGGATPSEITLAGSKIRGWILQTDEEAECVRLGRSALQ